LTPGFLGDVEEFVVVAIGSVRPAVAAEVVPQVFDAVEFRGVRRSRNQRDVRSPLKKPWDRLPVCQNIRNSMTGKMPVPLFQQAVRGNLHVVSARKAGSVPDQGRVNIGSQRV
jgi:hypothetical protein